MKFATLAVFASLACMTAALPAPFYYTNYEKANAAQANEVRIFIRSPVIAESILKKRFYYTHYEADAAAAAPANEVRVSCYAVILWL